MMLKSSIDKGNDFFHILLHQSSRSHCSSSNAHSRSYKRGLRIERHHVFVHGDFSLHQSRLCDFAGQAFGTQVDEHQVVVGAARAEAIAALDEAGGERLRVLHHLLAVGLELGLERLAERDGLRANHMHQRSALRTGEHLAIDLLGVLAEKTKGNLAEEESKELIAILTELRSRFVHFAQMMAAQAAQGNPAAVSAAMGASQTAGKAESNKPKIILPS